MCVLLVTDHERDKKLLETKLLESGVLNFHSISMTDNFLLWHSKLKIKLIVLYAPNSKKQELEKILKLCDPGAQLLLASQYIFPKYSNVIKLSEDQECEQILSFIDERLPEENAIKEDILIRINDKYKRVRTDDIEYLQADGKYITLNLGEREYSIRSSLKAMHLILPDNFIRIHSSYIVNANKIEAIHIHEQNIELISSNIPFSRKFKSEILSRFYLG